MVVWDANLPAAESVAAWERITALADAARHPGDPRTADARRADVLLDLLLGRPTATPDGRAGDPLAGRTWHTDVLVTANTLTGGSEPGELPGWGPITTPTPTAPPPKTTSQPPAPPTTGSKPHPAGTWNHPNQEPSSGPHPPDTATTASPNHPSTGRPAGNPHQPPTTPTTHPRSD